MSGFLLLYKQYSIIAAAALSSNLRLLFRLWRLLFHVLRIKKGTQKFA